MKKITLCNPKTTLKCNSPYFDDGFAKTTGSSERRACVTVKKILSHYKSSQRGKQLSSNLLDKLELSSNISSKY